MLQVYEQVAGEQRLSLFGAFARLDLFHFDLWEETGNVLVLELMGTVSSDEFG
ncbi:hypothetical protein K0B93_05840 [Marinobacter sp. F4218]|nr:hypothetical protein [Marinobacter sp. F4218]